MFNVSLVKLSNIETLEQALEKLENSRVLDQPVEDLDWPPHEVLSKRWNPVEPFDLEIIELQTGTRENVKFILAEGYNERTKRRSKWFETIEDEEMDLDLELNFQSFDNVFEQDSPFNPTKEILVKKNDRINVTKVCVVFFEQNGTVFMAPWMSPGTTLNTFCNDLLPEFTWGNVEKTPAEFHLDNDFFYWLLNAFTRSNKQISHAPNIVIRAWTGFLGTTQDTFHKLSGEGQKISVILSTLGFLFMNDPFKALNLSLQYENEFIPMIIGTQGNLVISEYEYEGQYSNAFLDHKRKALLTILAYSKVLPDLLKAYEEAYRLGHWNTAVKEDFTNWIGDNIIARVQKALAGI